MADAVMIGMPLAQAIGRWGNFINQEAHGGPTNLPWGIVVDGVKVHPTFLYESIWDVLIFVFLWILKSFGFFIFYRIFYRYFFIFYNFILILYE